MARVSQLLLSSEFRERLVHGGEIGFGKRKLSRPISTKYAMQVTMRSSLAKGEWSFLHSKNARIVSSEVQRLARRFGLRLYATANVGNHLHLVVRPRSRDALNGFLSALSGRLTQRITGARKGRPLGHKFFDMIPWTRIVKAWGKAYAAVKGYVNQNTLEALGIIAYTPREHRPPPKLRIDCPTAQGWAILTP